MQHVRYGTALLTLPTIPAPTSGGEPLQHPVVRHLLAGRIDDAIVGIRELGLTQARHANGTTVYSGEGMEILHTTIALSAELKPDTFSLDINNRCVINDKQGRSMDWDCDGDPIQLILFKELVDGEIITKAIHVKFPAPKLPPVWKMVPLPEPVLKGLSKAKATSLINEGPPVPDWIAAMKKTFTPQPIGTVTIRWWNHIMSLYHQAFLNASNN